ncbi:unnamed protein product [Diamesa tonsa]
MSNYEVPKWAGKPSPGLHLDIYKDETFIQKIMIDEKKCYLFGRNPELNDFRIDHSSCSRVHAALVYHKHLSITYLVDLGSSHGTYIGSMRLEAHKPTQMQINSQFHFGASTRNYILRERPSVNSIVEDIPISSEMGANLPESQDEVDNLTQYNTANNRKISTLGIANEPNKKHNKRKRVTFNEDEIVINPEDIDDSIGRFRNLVQSTVVPNKRFKMSSGAMSASLSFSSAPNTSSATENIHKNILHHPIMSANLYADLPSSSADSDYHTEKDESLLNPFASKLLLPNPAPEIEIISKPEPQVQFKHPGHLDDHHDNIDFDMDTPKKKKYAKEAWPKLARATTTNPTGFFRT